VSWIPFAACAVAIVATPLAMALARRTGLVDQPGPLKVQQTPVPYLGGLGVAAGLALAGFETEVRLLLPPLAALLLGVADDARDLDPKLRLAAECAIGVAVAAAVPHHGVVAFVVAAVATVVLINAVNLLDGLDALASGVGLAAAVGMAWVTEGDGRALALALAGALAGFLVWNKPKAKVYLGDGGAYLLGTVLAELWALSWRPGGSLGRPIAAALLVAVPLIDTTVAVVRRRRSGHPLFQGDRAHVYDQLVDRGLRAPLAVGCCILGQAVLATVGTLATRLGTAGAVAVTAVAVAAVIGGVGVLGFTRPQEAVG
jgi:UDP-GlcNAc:undecaprenyl-phosphate GlcNAc-1-phosphate transferase